MDIPTASMEIPSPPRVKTCLLHFRAVCRDKTKQGVCPKVPRDNKYASCTQDCTSDSDCDGDQKCCFNGIFTY